MRSIKCVIIGDGAVGKTSLLISYTTNTFPSDYVPTVFDNYTTTISIRDPYASKTINTDLSKEDQQPGTISSHSNENLKVFKLNLWDTAGQEEYDRLRPLSYPQTDIFLICFSVVERNSFRNVLDKWFPELKTNSNIENSEVFTKFNKYPILLVGTKVDLFDSVDESDPNFISKDEINNLVNEYRFMGYVECSAITQVGVRDVFEKAIESVAFEPERLAALQINNKQKSELNKTNLEQDNPISPPNSNSNNVITNNSKHHLHSHKKEKPTSNKTNNTETQQTNKRSKKSRTKGKCIIL